MSSKFRSTAAIIAIVTGLGGAAMAQTATDGTTGATPPAPSAPVTVTQDNLPDLLKALNLQNIDIDQDRRHVEVEGNLADGTQIEAKLDRQGQLRQIEADDDAALPAAVIDGLIPQAVRDADMFVQFTSINEIGLAPEGAPFQGVMIEGTDANGEEVRALFAEDGTLTRFGRGDDDHGKRGDRGGKHGDHGKRGDHGERGDRGGQRDGQDMGRGGPDGAAANAPDGGQPPAQLDDASITTILTEGGYADLGTITRDGPRTLIEAVNAAGENVTVEINPRGEVVRETAR